MLECLICVALAYFEIKKMSKIAGNDFGRNFFAAITNDNLGSVVSKVMKESMAKFDQVKLIFYCSNG